MFQELLANVNLNDLLAQGRRRGYPKADNRKEWNMISDKTRNELIAWGNEALEGYPLLTAAQYMAFVRTGDRQAFEKPYFERRRKLMGAVLAECALGDGTYMDAVADGLWLICEESSWVISAHNARGSDMLASPERPALPDVNNPCIDLFSAQTAATLAYTLFLLDDKLNKMSPIIADRVKGEIENRIVLPFLRRDDFWWMGVTRKDLNNWTPWILSNIIDTLMLTEGDRSRLTNGLYRAMRMLDSYLACIPGDGGCDEGAGYWNMAGGSLLDCLESLCLATGGITESPLAKAIYHNQLIRDIGAFPEKAHIQGPYYLNFADCDAKPLLDGERLYRYGALTRNEPLSALGEQVFHENKGVRPRDTPQMNRVLQALFNPAPEPDEPEEEPSGLTAFMELPILQVYAWRKGRLYAAVKGGHNDESHNHNDVGNFIIYADGKPTLIDVGNMVYTAKTFGPDRYTLWNTRAQNHNIPLIGDAEQQPGRAYRAKVGHADADGVSLALENAYPAEAGVIAFERRLALSQDTMILTDDIVLAQPLAVTWVFMCAEKPEASHGEIKVGSVVIRCDAALEAGVQVIPVTDARMARNFPGSVWRLTLRANPGARHHQVFDIAVKG